MHSATLAVAAYALLGSSFVSLFYLLRENIKKCVTSSLHIFSISDALSSIFAGIIFFVNQLNMDSTIHLENNINNATKFNRDFLHLLKNDEENDNEINYENSANCEFQYVLMQYGMFFIPFTNAFISLLGYSLHYITHIIRVDGSFVELIMPIKQIIEKETTKNKESLFSPGSSTGIKKESNFESIISLDKIKNTALNILEENTFKQPEKYDKITLISVVVEWLVPILITAILHFGEYQRISKERNLKNDECIFATNFPFDNCYLLSNQSEFFSSKILLNTTPHPVTLYNYTETEDSVRVINPNSEEIENVVSNVYKLVQSALDGNERKNSTHFNTLDMWNITKFIEKNSTSSENNDTDEWNLFENVEKAANETNLESDKSLDPKKKLESEIIYTSVENKIDYSNFETNISKTLGEKNKTDDDSNIVEIGTQKTISKNEIYADLIKKIQNGIQKVKLKEKTRLNRKIQSNQNSEFSTSESESQCSENKCFISTRFLKIHLIILLFIVYFIPILASTILNVCATYKFKQIKEKVETNCATLKILSNFGQEKVEVKNKNKDCEDVVKMKKVGWLSENQEESQKIEENGEEQTSPLEIEIINEEEIFGSILEDLAKAEKFSRIFKINLVLAILLWTPLFMEVLSKVFLCMNVPNWLIDSSFLGAVSFGIVRNFLNINMIKTLRIVDRTKKENSVHPSS